MKRRKDPNHGLIQDTVQFRADLVERGRTTVHRAFLNHYLASERYDHDNQFPRDWPVDTVLEHMVSTAENASLYAVTKDVWELVEASSATMPAETLQNIDLPARDGWLQLSAGVWMSEDVRGVSNNIVSVMWRQEVFEGRDGIRLWLFMDTHEPTFQGVEFPAELRRELPRPTLYHSAFMPFGQFVFAPPTGIGREEATQIADAMRTLNDNAYDTDSPYLEVTLLDGRTFKLEPSEHMRYLKSLFAFLKTQLVIESRGWPSRTTTKSLPAALRNHGITVVELRHVEYTGGGAAGTGHTMKHRRYVKPYWARRWLGSGEHKYQRWVPVRGHVRGPEGAPFRTTPIVNRISR